MSLAEKFRDIVTPAAPLGIRTCFKVGGTANYLATPRHQKELVELMGVCRSEGLPYRVLGGGSNSLVSDEGYAGVAIHLSSPDFCAIKIDSHRVTAGAGVTLAELISSTCKAGLSGLEVLVGIPGSVGGAVCKNAGGRAGDIGQFIESVEVITPEGTVETRKRSEVRFGYRTTDLDDVVVLSVTLQLVQDDPNNLVRRIKKIWIEKQAHQPFGFQNAGYAFRDPRGLSAADLIDKSGLRGTKVGGAELSDRDPRYVVAAADASSRDIQQLIDLVIARVEEQTGVLLELQIDVW